MTFGASARRRRTNLFFILFLLGLKPVPAPSQAVGEAESFYGGLAPSDLSRAERAVQRTLELQLSGRPNQWRNPRTGTSGTVSPVKTYRISDGRYCRDFREVVTADREPRSRHATACRDGDGRWIVVDTRRP